MKKLLVAAVCAVLLFSCQGNTKPADAAAAGTNTKADVSYAFGSLIGNSLKSTAVAIDYDAFLNGVKDVLDKNAPKVTLEKANETVQTAIADAQKRVAEENLAKETKFLEENGKKAGVTTTASGLQYEVLAQGTGPKPTATDTVKVDYVGTLLDGTTFDSSIERKQPATFPLNQIIPGWTEGIQLMAVGSKFKFTIPSKLAYGANGAGGKIGPNATLIFEVTLLEIEAPAKPAKK